ncbi:hypothetical protein KFE25_014103 [Diacronema lutheri]|uniref:Ion transport domain-containing protein n=2 Tax=Diacronema lutheri TaxID=2081491 RepID=A0A8J5X4L9_DIALT|nr:hypothetical protein KFE25_014103 [Diacronema lutheri]
MLHSAAALIGNRPGRASDARATVAHPGDAPMWSARRAAARAAMSPSPSRNERRANASPPRSGRGASEGHRPSSLIRFASADTFSALSSRIVRSTSAVDDALGMRDNAQEDDEPRPTYTFRQAVWFTFEEASFSTLARIISCCLLCVIALSVFSFVMSTRKLCHWTSLPGDEALLRPDAPVDLSSTLLRRVCAPDSPREPWETIERACILVFTAELAIRFLAAGDRGMSGQIPSRREFVRMPLNLLDVVAVAPFYVELIVQASRPDSSTGPSLDALAVVRVLRLTRVLRVFKLSKSSTGVLVLMRTVAHSLSAIVMLNFFVLVCLVLFAALMFVAEQGTYYESCECYLREDGTQSPFESILAAAWFCIVTMTTVGYGDVTPATGLGKAVASLCMVCGLVVISLPITIIGANFDEEWSAMEEDKRRKTLHALHRSMRDDAKPGITLALLRKLIALHRCNVQAMLQSVEAQMDDQAAQLDQLMAALRAQLQAERVPLGTAHSAFGVAPELAAAKRQNSRKKSLSRAPLSAIPRGVMPQPRDAS